MHAQLLTTVVQLDTGSLLADRYRILAKSARVALAWSIKRGISNGGTGWSLSNRSIWALSVPGR